MSAFALLIICLALGAIVSRLVRTPANLATDLNWWVINIALPALVLHVVPSVELNRDVWFLVASMWLVFAISVGLFAAIGQAFHWSRARIGALILVSGLGNTAFIGYPMIEALRGREALTLVAVADQGGCFVMLAIGGAIVTSLYSGQADSTLSAPKVLRRVFQFPPFLALVIGFIAGRLGGWPGSIDSILTRIGDTLVPLALFSVGLQIRKQFAKEPAVAASLGLSYKLVLAPMMVFGLGKLLGVGGLTLIVSTLQSAMAPMVSAAIMAEQHELEPRIANLMLMAGTLISFVSVPIVNWMLG